MAQPSVMCKTGKKADWSRISDQVFNHWDKLNLVAIFCHHFSSPLHPFCPSVCDSVCLLSVYLQHSVTLSVHVE